MICAWVITSSAVMGSSAITRRGRHASAIAIITRWRMPPENWCGYSFTRRAGTGMPTASSISRASFSLTELSCARIGSAIWRPTA